MLRCTSRCLSAGSRAAAAAAAAPTGAATDAAPSDDTELLDLLDVAEDTAVFLVRRDAALLTGAAQTAAGAATPHRAVHQPALPTSVLVGGTLFGRDPPRSSAAPLPGSRDAWTSARSIFCPFVRSFYSSRSQHWANLCAAGFGYGFSAVYGNRVYLADAPRLMRLAYQLQGRPVSTSPNRRHAETPPRVARAAASAPSDAARHEVLFTAWGWGPRLRRTLGATLCHAPLSSFAAFMDAIRAAVAEVDGKYGSRRIPVTAARRVWRPPEPSAVTRCALPRSTQPLRPWLTRCRTLQAPIDTMPQLLPHHHDRPLLPPPSPLPVDVGAVTAEASVLPEAPLGEAATAPPLPPRPLHGAGATLQLLGLPSEVRAAFLELPLPHATSADTMEAACAAALARLSAQLAEAVSAGAVAADAQLYVCPIAHAVDYSGTLDLRAFPVDWRGVAAAAGGPTRTSDNTTPSHAATTARVMEAVVRDAPPVLSLGVEAVHSADSCASTVPSSSSGADPPLRVVVFPNAHLLSRRAMRRLIDQWTRNGAVTQKILQREREQQTEPARAPPHRRQHWHTLMGGVLPLPPDASSVLPHVRTLAVPLGDVQAVFIGYAAASDETGIRNGLHADQLTPPPPSPRTPPHAELTVDTGVPRRDLLYVEEPLSAALLRASAAYRTALSPAARRDVVASVVRCVVEGAGPGTVLAHRRPTRLPSGRLVSDQRDVPLHRTEGRLLLHEACEAVLAVVSPFDRRLHPTLGTARGGGGGPTAASSHDDVVSLLLTYPFLSSLRLRHVLLSAFRVRLTGVNATATGGTASFAASAPCSPQRVRFVPSRVQLAHIEEREHHQRLAAAAPARGATLASTQASAHDAAPPPILEQVYAAYPEPPLLLGWWSPTLLFCAPTLADVVPLRTLLREALRERFDAHEAAAAVLAVGRAKEGRVRWEVEDVDIAHEDHTARDGPATRPHSRRFTVRASLRRSREARLCGVPAAEETAEVTADLGAALWRLGEGLQSCLKSVARAAVLFPLWSSWPRNAKLCKGARASMEEMRARSEAARPVGRDSAGGGGGGGSSAPGTFFSFPFTEPRTVQASGCDASFADFMGIDEAVTPWVPSLVEQRLFAMAAVQFPSLALTLGTRVVLLQSVRVPPAPVAASSQGTAGCLVHRGQVCEVVGFISRDALLRRGTAAAGSADAADRFEHRSRARQLGRPSTGTSAHGVGQLPGTVHRQLAELTGQEHQLIDLYLVQQRAATSLPLLQTSPHPGAAGPFVVVPRPRLVGGFRSVHHYGLPLLHLPLAVLAGGGGGPVPRAPCTVTSPAVSFAFALPHLLHPYCADPVGDRASLCLTAAERATALRLLFARSLPASSASEAEGAACTSPVAFAEDLLLLHERAGESAAPAAVTGPDASSPASAPPLHCPMLTELALFSR